MRKLLIGLAGLLVAGLWATNPAYAKELVVQMHLTSAEGIGKEIGTITAADSSFGLVLTPHLKDLPPGFHGFHVHQNADCNPGKESGKTVPALAAGGHYDPKGTGKHEGPYGEGHLGDLPQLYVASDGQAVGPVLAPHLKVSDLKGHSLMIHAGGDNYSDQPQKLGGGGARLACGSIK